MQPTSWCYWRKKTSEAKVVNGNFASYLFIYSLTTTHSLSPVCDRCSKLCDVTGSSAALAVAGTLLREGASVDACDDHRRSPLHWAVSVNTGRANSSTTMEQLLLDHRADPFAVDCRRRLPIHYVFTKIGRYTARQRERSQAPDLQNILRQSYDYLTIMAKLRSTYDGRLIHKTSYEGRKAFLGYDSLAESKNRLR